MLSMAALRRCKGCLVVSGRGRAGLAAAGGTGTGIGVVSGRRCPRRMAGSIGGLWTLWAIKPQGRGGALAVKGPSLVASDCVLWSGIQYMVFLMFFFMN